MKKNAFTLIELLAVIVILAIIALIATPIILGIIRDAKDQANERSAENYIDAVEQAIVRKNLEGEYNPEECKIENGEVTCKGKFSPKYCEIIAGQLNCEGVPLEVEIDGEVPTGGAIKINNGSVAIGTELIFKEFKATINEEGKLVVDKLDIQEESNTQQEGPEHLAKDNVRAVTESKTGIVPTQDEEGNIVPGSEFKIKVSNNIKDENDNILEYTFFVLSNSEDGKYVNLIAEQNITPDGTFTSEPQDNDEWYVTSSDSYDNRYGPQTAYAYLSTATNNWTNIPIIINFNYEDEGHKSYAQYGYQSLVISLAEESGKYITAISPVSGFSKLYENMRVRLPYFKEVYRNTTCGGLEESCPLWMVNYLSSNSYYSVEEGKVNSKQANYGYWSLSSASSASSGKTNSRCIYYKGRNYQVLTNSSTIGVRPVITVLKSDLLRVM